MSDYGPDLYHMLTSSGDERRRKQDVIVCSTFQASPIHSIDSVLRHDVASRLRRQKLYDERQRLYTEALLSYDIRNAREQNCMLREDEEMLQLDLQLRDLRENRGLRPLPPSPPSQTYRWPQRPKVVSAVRNRDRKLVSPMTTAEAEVKQDVISAALEGMLALEELERPADVVLSTGALQGLRRALLARPSMATVPPINVGAPANKQGDKEPTPQGNRLVTHLPRFEPSFGR